MSFATLFQLLSTVSCYCVYVATLFEMAANWPALRPEVTD